MPRHIHVTPTSAAPRRAMTQAAAAWEFSELAGAREPLLSNLQQGEERLLWDFDPSDLLHAFFAFLLLFEEFAFARDVPAVALCGNILPQRLDAFASDHFCSKCSLNCHF